MIGFYIHIPRFVGLHVGYTRRFRYTQRIAVHATYASGYRDVGVEARTRLRKRVLHVAPDYMRVEIEIEAISLYDDGYFLGEVDRIPGDLRRVTATIYNDGYVEFDRMAYLVGDPEVGFELISTRYTGGHVLNEYQRGHGLRVGYLDLYDGRVVRTDYSELFDPYDFSGYAPVALIPHDEYWGFQYMAGGYASDDAYYYGGEYDYYDRFDAYDEDYFYREDAVGYGVQGDAFSTGSSGFVPAVSGRSFSNEGFVEYQTAQGHEVQMEQSVRIEPLEGR